MKSAMGEPIERVVADAAEDRRVDGARHVHRVVARAGVDELLQTRDVQIEIDGVVPAERVYFDAFDAGPDGHCAAGACDGGGH